jgi:hypothetical protein
MSFDRKAAVNERHAAALATADARLRESERFHMGNGKVHKTMEALTQNLENEGIDYVIVGGMALNAHGYQRETVDVNLLVTPDGLARFVSTLVGTRYRPAFENAYKSFEDINTGVKIKFVIAGEFPGGDKPNPVSFPNPAQVALIQDGMKYISLPGLITIKLTSGMTNPGRLRDLADVQELIKHARLTEHIADELHPYVRSQYLELFFAVCQNTRPEE